MGVSGEKALAEVFVWSRLLDFGRVCVYYVHLCVSGEKNSAFHQFLRTLGSQNG